MGEPTSLQAALPVNPGICLASGNPMGHFVTGSISILQFFFFQDYVPPGKSEVNQYQTGQPTAQAEYSRPVVRQVAAAIVAARTTINRMVVATELAYTWDAD